MQLNQIVYRTIPVALAALALACGSDADDALTAGNAGASGTGGTTSGGSGGSGGSSGVAGESGSAGANMGGTGGLDGGEGGMGGEAGTGGTQDAGVPVVDPAVPGPYQTVDVQAAISAPEVGSTVNTKCFLPDTATGSFPLVTLAPGFQLPPAQYFVSASHLASFGFVVCVPGYNASMLSPNHTNNAKEILAVIDWATNPSSPVFDKVDTSRIGAAGHSLGGRLSVIAASMDNRIDAVFGIDPVDANNPNATVEKMPLPIPTGFLGELLDSEGGFQPCAPAADNFETFYASATTPSFKVEVLGANHMSFLDDPSTCGLLCSFCKSPTLEHSIVIGLTRSYLAAFFLRHLGNQPAYDDYLIGTIAQERYIQTGIALLESK